MIFPLIGNNKIRQSLENVLKERHLPHAVLIDGDTGTGKHTLADYISVSAVCSGEEIPCGECKNCSLALSKNHPDIIKISPLKGKKSISVEQIRELIADAYIKPHISPPVVNTPILYHQIRYNSSYKRKKFSCQELVFKKNARIIGKQE